MKSDREFTWCCGVHSPPEAYAVAISCSSKKAISERMKCEILLRRQQFPSACESVENGVFFGERFVEDSGAKLSWST
jgi:hypothetical protein